MHRILSNFDIKEYFEEYFEKYFDKYFEKYIVKYLEKYCVIIITTRFESDTN